MELKKIKKRNWAFVVWPDSAPENWRDLLQETGLMFAISPYHNKDINPDGTEKKPHYHVIMTYDGPTTFNNALQVAKLTNANTVQPLEQIRGYYRYFTHIDNPEKYQYKDSEITTINGFDINNYIEMTYTEVARYLLELQNYIRNEKFLEYSDLLDFLVDNDLKELWDVARNHTLLLNTYINSRRFKTKQENLSKEEKSSGQD